MFMNIYIFFYIFYFTCLRQQILIVSTILAQRKYKAKVQHELHTVINSLLFIYTVFSVSSILFILLYRKNTSAIPNV